MTLTKEERQRINPDLWRAVFASYIGAWHLGMPNTEEKEVLFTRRLEEAEQFADLVVWRMVARSP